jgi:hypothetical protein
MIVNPHIYASNQTSVTHYRSDEAVRLLSDVHTRRRSGLIVNKSRHTLLIHLGQTPPPNRADWLVIPHLANCDLPFLYIGKIWGCWLGMDANGASIFEFYGDYCN